MITSNSADTMPSPPTSPPATKSSRRPSNLSLDLSDLPSLTQPSPPSNTLLITNLQDPTIFTPPILSHIQALVQQHTPGGIHTFCPLRSMRRIIITFLDVESAISIRSVLDGEVLFGNRIKIYFGNPTPINSSGNIHLAAPKLDKQFFISPPPSPPAGWEIREEDPPNKDVHAEDLASALERLSARAVPIDQADGDGVSPPIRRSRSGTGTIVYAPEDHGHSQDAVPAIAVEDTTVISDIDDYSPTEGGGRIIAHTSRPPVELMQ